MFVKFGKEFRLDIGNNYLNVEVFPRKLVFLHSIFDSALI